MHESYLKIFISRTQKLSSGYQRSEWWLCKKSLETHSPLFFNDSIHWNSSSWHHFWVPEPKLMPSGHIITFALTIGHDESVFYRISVSSPVNTWFPQVKKKINQLITECVASKILPMTSPYGQGNFSVQPWEQEMRRVQRPKRLQKLWRTEIEECFLKVALF